MRIRSQIPSLPQPSTRRFRCEVSTSNLTMALYWIRPATFLPLDQNSRTHLKISLPPNGLSAAAYTEILKRFQGKSFPELSHEAWLETKADGGKAPTVSSPQSTDVWLVGAYWSSHEPKDQTERFVSEGIWQNGFKDKFLDEVKSMKAGDRIAIKAATTQKDNLPFNAGGKTVSSMIIKAIGTVVANRGDGMMVEVEWVTDFVPKALVLLYESPNGLASQSNRKQQESRPCRKAYRLHVRWRRAGLRLVRRALVWR